MVAKNLRDAIEPRLRLRRRRPGLSKGGVELGKLLFVNEATAGINNIILDRKSVV